MYGRQNLWTHLEFLNKLILYVKTLSELRPLFSFKDVFEEYLYIYVHT